MLHHLRWLLGAPAPGCQAVVLPVMTPGERGVIGRAVAANVPLASYLSRLLGLLMLLVLVMLLWLLLLLLLLVMMMRRVYRQHWVQGVVVVGGSHGLDLPTGVPRHTDRDRSGLVLLGDWNWGWGGTASSSSSSWNRQVSQGLESVLLR